MFELLHKMMYTGIGFAAMTEEKARNIVSEMEKKGQVSAEEGKRIVDDMVSNAKEQSAEFRNMVNEEVSKVMESINPVTKKDIEEIKARLDKLEASCSKENGEG